MSILDEFYGDTLKVIWQKFEEKFTSNFKALQKISNGYSFNGIGRYYYYDPTIRHFFILKRECSWSESVYDHYEWSSTTLEHVKENTTPISLLEKTFKEFTC
jgi:hypothetical protein